MNDAKQTLCALHIARLVRKTTAQQGILLFMLVWIGVFPGVASVQFTPPGAKARCFDFVEGVLRLSKPQIDNPFTGIVVEGSFGLIGEKPLVVEGFCDAPDGSVHRIRFMPSKPGRYQYRVQYKDDKQTEVFEGTFLSEPGERKGVVRVDPEFPRHFQWDGSKERYFWNGTTAYWLAGWDDETIAQIIERLDRLKVTRIRVALNGRVKDGQAWFEPVYPTEKFSFLLNPWVAKNPDSVEKPDFDVTRFNIAYWQKFERLLGKAREKDMVVSVIFYVDGRRPGVDPFGQSGMGGPEEQRYYRYAIARLAPYSNIMWDLANEYRLFRDDAWADKMGAMVKKHDPYSHLVSTHGHADFRFRTAPWADFAMYQCWDEHGGWDFMLKNQQEQAKTGRIIPQVNEEYGYEDHYPQGWGENRKAPARSAETRRRIAWEIYLAGGYQTTGERANPGAGPSSGASGGWINGLGDNQMTLFDAFAPIYDFFNSISFWKLAPDPELVVSTKAAPRVQSSRPPSSAESRPVIAARSEKGDLAVIYFPAGGEATLKSAVLADGLRPLWFNPRDGGVKVARAIKPFTYRAPDTHDWVLTLSVPCNCSFREHDNEFDK